MNIDEYHTLKDGFERQRYLEKWHEELNKFRKEERRKWLNERRKANHKKNKKENPEKYILKRRIYYQKNKEKLKKKNKIYRQKNNEKIRKLCKKYREEQKMKTTKGIAITFLGGGVCIRCDWFMDGSNILISEKDYCPELLYRIIENLRTKKPNMIMEDVWKPVTITKVI